MARSTEATAVDTAIASLESAVAAWIESDTPIKHGETKSFSNLVKSLEKSFGLFSRGDA